MERGRVEPAEPLQTETRELGLSLGENVSISAVGIKTFSEGDNGVVQVKVTPDGKTFVVVGKKPGQTSLLLIRKDGSQLVYKIEVFRLDMSIALSEINQLLAGTTGLRVRRVGARLFIEGGVSTEAELNRVQKVASLYPGQVESLVTVGGAAADRKQNVRLDVYFIQFDRKKGYRVGINYPTGIVQGTLNASYDLLAPGFSQATAEIAGQALPGLDLAASRGWARVLKHSTLITSNGAEATFASGGEQNFRVSGGLGGDIKPVKYGATVKVLPRFDSATREMEIRVNADSAELVAEAVSDIPSRTTSDLSTLVSLKLGQGLVLSGMYSKGTQHTVRGIPLLSDIPFIGVLFGSHNDEAQDREVAIYLVPSIVDAVPLRETRLLEELMRRYEDYSGGTIEKRYEPLTRSKPKAANGAREVVTP